MRHKAQKSLETSSNVPYYKAGRIWDGALKFGWALKISLERVRPRKWRETTIFGKACVPTSPGLKYWPEWCPTSRSLRANLGYMKFVEIERNFLGLKTSSARVLRGTKCPKNVPKRAS